ncbi:MAG: 2-amino-4-hydroxy-6-hydroxymethyldihydropteridine diphosphokinase [Parachlamydiaceae bacterium]
MLIYIALGGNFPNTRALFDLAIEEMKTWGKNFECSSFYVTKAVSDIEQADYINGCVRFWTDLLPLELFRKMEALERKLGKVPKEKNRPRPIDLDLIFYGDEAFELDGLIVPHPRFHEREFVLMPLLDLTEEVGKYQIGELLNEVRRSRKN